MMVILKNNVQYINVIILLVNKFTGIIEFIHKRHCIFLYNQPRISVYPHANGGRGLVV